MPFSDFAALSSFFELTPDLVCIATKEGYFHYVNQAVVKKLEYSREELFVKPISFFLHPDDREHTQRRREHLLEGIPLHNLENRYISKSGKTIWLHWTSIYNPTKKLVFAIAKDITERKLKEKAIEEEHTMFKSLAGHFKSKMEKDKKTLATELHEELAQLASAAKIDMSWLYQKISPMDDQTLARLQHAMDIQDILIKSISRISYAISPTMLDDMGLNETIRWLCEEFGIRNDIPCIFETGIDDQSLAHEIQLDLFRICQEALSNVMHHAEATFVKVTLEPINDSICLTIEDDGKGFNPLKVNDSPGLDSIRKRAASIQGQLEIKSSPGNGTTISVTIRKPFHIEDKN